MAGTINPRQHDEAEAALYSELDKAQQAWVTLNERIHRAAGDKRGWQGRRPAWGMTDSEALGRCGDQALVTALQVNAGLTEAIRASIGEAETIYRQHGWVRFFLCTNRDGHIHSSLHCSSLDRGQYATGMVWLPEVSGTSVEQAVGTYKEGLCTKCFPGAPVAWYERRDGDEKAARQAERDARAEAKFIKRLREGELFRVDGSLVETVFRCKEILRDEVEYRDYYGHGEHPFHAEYVTGAARATEVLLAREAAAPGTGATQAEIDKIVAGAVKRNIKDGARLNADGSVKA